MLDINFIRENATLVQEATRLKNFPVDISHLLALDSEIRSYQHSLESLQAERNSLSKELALPRNGLCCLKNFDFLLLLSNKIISFASELPNDNLRSDTMWNFQLLQ